MAVLVVQYYLSKRCLVSVPGTEVEVRVVTVDMLLDK